MTSACDDNTLIFYHVVGIDPDEESGFINAVTRLPQILVRPPLGVEIQVRPLPTQAYGVVESIASGCSLPEGISDARFELLDVPGCRTFIVTACRNDHPLAQLARKGNPKAVWGATCGRFALVYNLGNPYGVWHEALHLLRAQDCYAADDHGPTCELQNCIMQYAATHETVGDWPFLCAPNCDRVRRFVRGIAP
jgi:hypothetical protein